MNDDLQTIPKIEFPMDFQGMDLLIKLSRWSKVLGIFLIAGGIFNCLAIFTYSSNFIMVLFVLAVGIFLMFLGTRLTAASAYFKYCIHNPDSESFVTALSQIQSFIFLTATIYIAGSVAVLIIVILMIVFGMAIGNFTY